MKYNLITPELYAGQSMLGVYESRIYFSSKAKKDTGIRQGNFIQLYLDAGQSVIAVKMVGEENSRRLTVGRHGYCTTNIGRTMGKGRYLYQGTENNKFIFKKI